MSAEPEVKRLGAIAPLVAPLPPLSDDEVFTPEQWSTFFALCEVFIPAVLPTDDASDKGVHPSNYEKMVQEIQRYVPTGVDRQAIEKYLAEPVTSLPGMKEALRRRFLNGPKADRDGLASILSALNTTLGSVLMTGSSTPIQQQSIGTRVIIIRKWSQSYLGLFRKLHNTFAMLSKVVYLYQSDMLFKIVGYPGTHADAKRKPTYEFKFMDFSPAEAATTVNTDVVIIGSGPGAATVTNRLAKAGLRCTVLEKGYHFNSDHFPMTHADAQTHLYENFGFVVSDDATTATAAGSSFGGGGTVNWLASLQPPFAVREDWDRDHGLTHATTGAYQESFDYVCDKMGAARSIDHNALSKIKHNYANEMLLEGARKLGMEAKIVPQNTGGEEHDCGHCHMGCPSCTKKGPANLWFPEAAEHGTKFIQGCWAEKILFADDSKTATGVLGVWTSPDRTITKKITIKANRVIVSSGSLQSPLLLRRSGLANHWIGKNFHQHPLLYIYAVMPQRIDPWQGGGILTTVVTALKHGTGDGYGPVIEICAGFPTHTGTSVPISNKAPDGGVAGMKVNWAKLGHTVTFLCMVRDKDSGEVYADKNDPKTAHVKYTVSRRDTEQIVDAQIAAAKIAYVMGAKEIDALHPDIHPFVRSEKASQEVNDEAFRHWLEDVKTKGALANAESLLFHSAHQFGTCKMSGKSDDGVVDGQGRVWGYKNLWVADSSVLPTATGVNPMISTMGNADWIARGIEEEWQES